MGTRDSGDKDWDSLLGLGHAWKAKCASLLKSSQDLIHSSVLPEHPLTVQVLDAGEGHPYLHALQQPCPFLVPLALFLLHVQAELSQSAIDFSHLQSAAVQLSYGSVSSSCCTGQLLPKKGRFLLV